PARGSALRGRLGRSGWHRRGRPEDREGDRGRRPDRVRESPQGRNQERQQERARRHPPGRDLDGLDQDLRGRRDGAREAVMRTLRIVAASILVALAVAVASPAPATVTEKPVYPGAKLITLKTATSGVGAHPILRWKAVTGAAAYQVVVQTPKGQPYW